jgi:hypothetical protein
MLGPSYVRDTHQYIVADAFDRLPPIALKALMGPPEAYARLVDIDRAIIAAYNRQCRGEVTTVEIAGELRYRAPRNRLDPGFVVRSPLSLAGATELPEVVGAKYQVPFTQHAEACGPQTFNNAMQMILFSRVDNVFMNDQTVDAGVLAVRETVLYLKNRGVHTMGAIEVLDRVKRASLLFEDAADDEVYSVWWAFYRKRFVATVKDGGYGMVLAAQARFADRLGLTMRRLQFVDMRLTPRGGSKTEKVRASLEGPALVAGDFDPRASFLLESVASTSFALNSALLGTLTAKYTDVSTAARTPSTPYGILRTLGQRGGPVLIHVPQHIFAVANGWILEVDAETIAEHEDVKLWTAYERGVKPGRGQPLFIPDLLADPPVKTVPPENIQWSTWLATRTFRDDEVIIYQLEPKTPYLTGVDLAAAVGGATGGAGAGAGAGASSSSSSGWVDMSKKRKKRDWE